MRKVFSLGVKTRIWWADREGGKKEAWRAGSENIYAFGREAV